MGELHHTKKRLTTHLTTFSGVIRDVCKETDVKARIFLTLLNDQRGLLWVPAPSQSITGGPVVPRGSPLRTQTANESRHETKGRFI